MACLACHFLLLADTVLAAQVSFEGVVQPRFPPGAGFSQGCPVPEELKGLTLVEQALISRIQCVMTCSHVKGTGTGSDTLVLKSHVTFVDRSESVEKVHEVLPLLAAEALFVVLRRERGGVQRDTRRGVSLLCRKAKVKAALEWLKANSPAYSDVHIDAGRVAALPESGPLGVGVVDDGDEVAVTGGEDLGPAPAQREGPPSVVPRAGPSARLQVKEWAETASGTCPVEVSATRQSQGPQSSFTPPWTGLPKPLAGGRRRRRRRQRRHRPGQLRGGT